MRYLFNEYILNARRHVHTIAQAHVRVICLSIFENGEYEFRSVHTNSRQARLKMFSFGVEIGISPHMKPVISSLDALRSVTYSDASNDISKSSHSRDG